MLHEYTPEFIEKFWSFVDRSNGPDECWPWSGGCFSTGYGRIGLGGKNRLTHRIAADLSGIELGELDCLHKCDNPPCCNPAHLFPGNDRDNMRDMIRKGRAPEYKYYGTPMPGERNPAAKLTEAAVVEIRALRGVETQRVIAARFGVRVSTICLIQNGKRWNK